MTAFSARFAPRIPPRFCAPKPLRSIRARGAPIRELSSDSSRQRIQGFHNKLRERYPNISTHHFPSLTAAFLILHELTAIIPLFGSFFLLQSSGAGERTIDWIKENLTECSGRPQSNDSSGEITHYLRSFITTAFDEASKKISPMAIRYGWVKSEDGEELDVNDTLSMIDGGIVANGLVAYLCVKLLLPARVGLSLYLAPSFARLLRGVFALNRKK